MRLSATPSRAWWLCLSIALPGCGGAPPAAAVDVGARRTAEAYTLAILHKDWAGAYACLHPDSKAALVADKFASLAKSYGGAFGFEPDDVKLRSLHVQGSEAVAHVAFRGHGASGYRYYKDGVLLRGGDAGWWVVLPINFGKRRTP
jgi:hypothetical protein